MGLPYRDKKLYSQYSLGMKQRLAIALAVMHDPELLILDEPINGLDPIGIAEVRAFIRELCSEREKTILISSHILSEIALLADDIGILDKGVLLEEESIGELEAKSDRHVRFTISRCEFLKIRRKKLFGIAFLTTFIMHVFYAAIMKEPSLDNFLSVVQEENGFLILIPLSVILAANLFFEEQDHDTLKNLLCIPVTRGRLALAKLSVILVFDVLYELTGSGVSLLLALLSHVPLKGILIAFAYTVLGYILHISDAILRVPLGFNLPTFLPVPVIFRWLYQFHSLEDAGPVLAKFYADFSPYFVPTPAVFGILAGEALFCVLLIVKVYGRQKL